MKKIFISVLALVITTIAFSQDFEHTSFFTGITEPLDYDEGISAGFQYEYQNKTIYVGPEILMKNDEFEAPTYKHYIGRFGLNKHFGRFFTVARAYAGVRAGFVHREKGHALIGLETGADIFIPRSPIYVRFSFASDTRSDSKEWSNDPSHTVNSVILGVGTRF